MRGSYLCLANTPPSRLNDVPVVRHVRHLSQAGQVDPLSAIVTPDQRRLDIRKALSDQSDRGVDRAIRPIEKSGYCRKYALTLTQEDPGHIHFAGGRQIAGADITRFDEKTIERNLISADDLFLVRKVLDLAPPI